MQRSPRPRSSSASADFLDDRRAQLEQPLHLARWHGGFRHVLVRLAAERCARPRTATRLRPGHRHCRYELARLVRPAVRPVSASTSTKAGIQPVAATALDDRRRANGAAQPAMCACIDLRADGGGPSGHSASANASTGTRSPSRAANAASTVRWACGSRTAERPSTSSTGPRTRTSTAGDRTAPAAASTVLIATVAQPAGNRAQRRSTQPDTTQETTTTTTTTAARPSDIDRWIRGPRLPRSMRPLRRKVNRRPSSREMHRAPAMK